MSGGVGGGLKPPYPDFAGLGGEKADGQVMEPLPE